MSEKEMFQSVMFLIEIERKRQEKLATIRQELALIGKVENVQPDKLSIKLY